MTSQKIVKIVEISKLVDLIYKVYKEIWKFASLESLQNWKNFQNWNFISKVASLFKNVPGIRTLEFPVLLLPTFKIMLSKVRPPKEL